MNHQGNPFNKGSTSSATRVKPNNRHRQVISLQIHGLLPSFSLQEELVPLIVAMDSRTPFTMILLVLSLLACATGLEDGDGLLGASFLFGDSLVDAGNNNYLTTLSRANLPPNGIDFKPSGGQPTGRFTNGRTIGEQLGQPNFALPFLAPNATGPVILNGVNYASGGGGILNQTGRLFVGRIGMDVQVDFFNVTRKQVDQLLGPAKAKNYIMKDSIFSVTIGSNDFLNNYLLPVVSVAERLVYTPNQFTDSMITNLRSQLTRLYTLDARKFVVANVGPLGCIPYQKSLSGLDEKECAELPNQVVTQYNGKLKDLLAELNDNLPGASFCLANVYDLVMELISNYPKYGFDTASQACCGSGGQYRGLIPCGPTTSLCEDHSKHVFWDPYHPSEAANLILAKELVHGDKYISPMNLYTLRHL
ncbi:GDSL esterase/lipase [Nymphaea thermarum]|nr:GDSL esterase/lipase [Nymphaea thermarum]